ncbi:MAG: LPS-assembly lipoprotein LptE [Gammaproteobacteria bacterium]
MKFSKVIIVFLFALGLNACGFHLRGMGESMVKFKKVYLEGASGHLQEQFNEVLKMSSAKLASNPKEADLLVKVVEEKFNRRGVSLNFSGRSNEFELYYRLEYRLAGADNAYLAADKPLEINRSYYNDQQDILAKNNEESVIRGEMYRQAVVAILDRAKSQIKTRAK